MDIQEYLSECSIAIVKHTYTPTGGAEQELLRYLVPRAKAITYLSHPFADARGVPLNTAVTFFEGGKQKEGFLTPLIKGPSLLLFAKDVFFTLWYLIGRKTKFQIYVGVDNLNAYSGILLRRLSVVERVIFYVIDYAPQRFRSHAGQALYRSLDRRCCYGADAVWNVSASMEEARKQDGIDADRCAAQIEVPLGNRYSEIPRLSFEEINPNMVVFLGSLTQEQGLSMMIEAMPKLKQDLPNIKLRIIGDGPESPSLKRLAAEKNVSDRIEFMGFIEDDARVARLVAEGAVGIAPYVQTGDTYKRFADPGKVKIYLAAGLPAVISRVPRVAKVIDESEAGVAIEPDANTLADALTGLLSSPERLRRFRSNAAALGQKFDWDSIFERAFTQTFKCWGK